MKRTLAIVCISLFGCGGSDDNGNAAPTSVTPSGSAAVTVGPNGSMMFSPSAVTITTGGTVNWTWPSGSLPHTVTSGVPGMPDGKFCSLPAGQMPSAQACSGLAYAVTGPATYSHTFTTPGTFPYFCQVHGAMMTGSVTVIAASSTGGTTGATTGATTGGTTGATTGGTTGATTGGTGGTSGATTGGTSGTSGTTGHY